VDAAEILRTARRQAGLSQRGMASASGVSVATLAAVEAGRRIPSYAVIEAVLAAAGLEIAVDRRVPVASRSRAGAPAGQPERAVAQMARRQR
jgi:transcriptional regulator with XRE-family HTH domain